MDRRIGLTSAAQDSHERDGPSLLRSVNRFHGDVCALGERDGDGVRCGGLEARRDLWAGATERYAGIEQSIVCFCCGSRIHATGNHGVLFPRVHGKNL